MKKDLDEINLSVAPNELTIPIELIMNPNIPESCKTLFGIFNLYKNKTNGCWASNSFLFSILRHNERTITRNIKILSDWGYIKITNKNKSNKRRIFICNFKSIYGKFCNKIYDTRRNPEKIDNEFVKAEFLRLRNEYFEKENNG